MGRAWDALRAGPIGGRRDLFQRRGQRCFDRPRLRPDGGRPLGHLRGRARRQFRPWRDNDHRHVPRHRAVQRSRARPIGDGRSAGGRAVRARLCNAGRHHQSVHHPARVQPVHLAGRGRDHRHQRPADRVRTRCPQRPDVLFVRQLPGRTADHRRDQSICRRSDGRDHRRAIRLFSLCAARQGDPCLCRQLYRRAGGGARRQAPLCAHVRSRRRLCGGRGRDAGAVGRRDAGAGARLDAACLHHRHHRRPRLHAGRAARRRADRAHRGHGRFVLHPVGQEHVLLRPARAGAAVPPAGHLGQEAVMIGRLFAGVPRRGVALLAALLVVLLAAPWMANDYLLTVLIIILYSAYTGQAWNVMMGFAGQLSLGHAIYVGLGGYAAAALYVHFGLGPWIGLAAAIAIAVACGAVIGFLAFRFGVGGVYFAILTIAFAEFARIGFDHFGWVGGSSGFFLPVANYARNDLWNLRGNPAMFYYVMLALTVAAFLMCHALLRSRVGYYWQAIREDEQAARSLGINTFRYKMIAIIVSSGMTAPAGVFYAFYYNNLFPEQTFFILRSIEIILGPIIGGVGTLFGPVIGAFMITGLAEVLQEFLNASGFDAPGVKQVFYGICLLLVVLVLPDGVWPPLRKALGLERRASD